ncbi:MAG: hypothetical protein ABI540_01100 [Spartobacteria bacterium]
MLNVATAKANSNNSFDGLAIGFTVVTLAGGACAAFVFRLVSPEEVQRAVVAPAKCAP